MKNTIVETLVELVDWQKFEQPIPYNEKFLSISNIGYFFLNSQRHTYRPDGRNDYLLIYIEKGQFTIRTNGKLSAYPEGTIIIYKPGEVQDFYYPDNIATHTYWVHFDGHEANKILSDLKLDCKTAFHCSNATFIPNAIKNMFYLLTLKTPYCNTVVVQSLSNF